MKKNERRQVVNCVLPDSGPPVSLVRLYEPEILAVLHGYTAFTGSWTEKKKNIETRKFGTNQRYWNRRYNISIWMTKSNVFFK